MKDTADAGSSSYKCPGQERGHIPRCGITGVQACQPPAQTIRFSIAHRKRSNVYSLKFSVISAQAQIYLQFNFPALSSKFHFPVQPHLETSIPGSLPVPALELDKGAPALSVAPLLVICLSLEQTVYGSNWKGPPRVHIHPPCHTPASRTIELTGQTTPAPLPQASTPEGEQGQYAHSGHLLIRTVFRVCMCVLRSVWDGVRSGKRGVRLQALPAPSHSGLKFQGF